MAQVIYDDPNTRAIKEQQALRKLTQELNESPTQERIYQIAYNTPYPVFADEFGTTKAKNKIDKYLANLYTAGGRIRKQVENPQADKAYRRGVRDVFSEYDPLTRQNIVQNLSQARRGARENMFGKAFNVYQGERQKALFDYGTALNQQNQALKYASEQEQALAEAQAAEAKRQQDLQDYVLKKQIDLQYRAPSISRQSSSTGLTSTQKLEMLGLGLDPNNPDNIAQYAQVKVQDMLQQDQPAPGSAEDIIQVRQGIASDISNGHTKEEITQNLINNGYNPDDFSDLLDTAQSAEAENYIQTPGILQGLFGKYLFRKG